jgi:hypothetical protein
MSKCAWYRIGQKRPLADKVDGSCSNSVECAIVQLLSTARKGDSLDLAKSAFQVLVTPLAAMSQSFPVAQASTAYDLAQGIDRSGNPSQMDIEF